MSTSSSEEGSQLVGRYTASSGLESTGSLLSLVPSNSSAGQTEITPPTSPSPSESKVRTPRDILDASLRLGQVFLHEDGTLTKSKSLKQVHPCVPLTYVASDEAGYDADGDGDEDGNGDEGILRAAGAGTMRRPTRRPTFVRFDTRQHRRVASMLATDLQRTSPHPNSKFGALLPASRQNQKSAFAASISNTECYELRRRPRTEPEPERGLRPSPVGLGIGFPENHPLRNRAFSMPAFPSKENPSSGAQKQVHPRCKWWSPSGSESESPPTALAAPSGKQCRNLKKPSQVDRTMDVCALRPVRRVSWLRPAFMEGYRTKSKSRKVEGVGGGVALS